MEEKTTAEPKEELGIVSVNTRSGKAGNTFGKVAFVVVVGSVIVIGLLMGVNKWKANRKADAAKEEQAAKVENKPAQVGPKRVFETDSVFSPTKATSATGKGGSSAALLDRGVIVPAVEIGADEIGRPIPLVNGNGRGGTAQPATPVASRFGGDAILASTSAPNAPRTQHLSATGPEAAISLVRDLLGGPRPSDAMEPGSIMGAGSQPIQASMSVTASDASSTPPAPVSAGYAGGSGVASPVGTTGVGMPPPPGPAASGAGSIGGLLTPSSTPKVQAGMLGDRNMILPKGKSIDCALTVRVINEVAGMATCVLNSDVYSDNGRVVLLDRGSEAVGEYSATMAQGQRRLFLLWTRVKTPNGVVINLNSPAADELGTSGLSGYVDNHWWDRLGAAFLLSIVQDAIGFATAQSAGGGAQGQLSIYQNSATTGNRMAELVLQSTINIKPTLYKNQGDRATIFVARDLNFGTVYGLQPN
jgi:type IV secretion system protein VirB10